MTHSVEDLLDIVRFYYPSRMLVDQAGYKESEQHRRLTARRKKAAAEAGPWHAMVRRLEHDFPADNIINDSLGLSTGGMDAAYSCKIFPTGSTNDLTLGCLVSFLVPYYIVYSSRLVEDLDKEIFPSKAERTMFIKNTCYILPAGSALPLPETPDQIKPTRRVVSFDFSADDHSYVTWFTREIEAIGAYERLPPEIGKIVVPEVATNLRYFGEATLYDCLFADDWLK